MGHCLLHMSPRCERPGLVPKATCIVLTNLVGGVPHNNALVTLQAVGPAVHSSYEEYTQHRQDQV